MNKPIIIGIALFVIALGTILFLVRQRQTHPPVTAGSKPISAQPQTGQISRRINVKLFFANADGTALIPEERSILYHEDLFMQAKEVVRELTLGPHTDLVPTIPANTQLRDLFITKEGTAYVDFSQELKSGHNGGSTAEIATVYSIVNTLTLNFPQIKKVQILVNDQVVDTLAGHLDLSRPLSQDLTTIKTQQPAKTQS